MAADETSDQLAAAKARFLADALAVDVATRRTIIAKLSRYTTLGGVRLLMPGRVQVPAAIVEEVIDELTATL